MNGKAETAREERLAAKLRENLRRRKAQARALGSDDAAQPASVQSAADSDPPLSKTRPNG